MVTLNTYVHSSFAQSGFVHQCAKDLHLEVKTKMRDLVESGTAGNCVARILSPFVGLGTYAVTLCLRIGTIIEPIIGILGDLIAAIVFSSTMPLVHILFRFGHLFRNAFSVSGYLIKDIFVIGIGATVGGIIAPSSAYDNLSEFIRSK